MSDRYAELERDHETSARLGRVRQHGTSAELEVRSFLWSLGFRYRTRNRDLPGAPDIANRKRRWAVFVHGCFWHAHAGCRRATIPKRNSAFWAAKFDANRARDAAAVRALQASGYRTVVVWQCELEEQPERTKAKLRRALSETSG